MGSWMKDLMITGMVIIETSTSVYEHQCLLVSAEPGTVGEVGGVQARLR